MIDLSQVKHFEPADKLVKVLMKRNQASSPLFFRVLVAYYFAKVASFMHTNINTPDRGIIPINLYALNLSPSGFGKGFSTNIIEEQVINLFKHRFLNETFPILSEKNVAKLAVDRAIKYNEDEGEMLEKVEKEFRSLGNLAFSFDSGTSPAVKQMRQLILMGSAGAVSLEIDEIGSNLLSNVEVLTTFLELYDVGKVKQKLTKNTVDNKRSEEIEGRTPTNMMLFGTPTKLLDGYKTQDEFMSMLETGYARRCLFGYNKVVSRRTDLTPEEVYAMMTDTSSEKFLTDLSVHIGNLAELTNFKSTINMSKAVTLKLIAYKIHCDQRASKMSDYEEVQKSELSHRYYKAMKLAGAYAFIDRSAEITEEILYSAIKLVEESGTAFSEILNRERNYALLARYVAGIGREVTQIDMMEDLPFYKGGISQRSDLMTQAVAWGYKNNILIKRSFSEGIEFFSGEAMEETNLDKVRISYSTDIAHGYKADYAPFDKLHTLTGLNNYHYTSHHFREGHRNSTNLIQGFNLVILDVDGGTPLSTAKMLLKDYACLFATTKRHTDKVNRYRIIIPLSHTVKLTPVQHIKFMENIFSWLPITVDQGAKDCARKWLSNASHYEYNEGSMLDALLFIPQTKKEEEQAKKILDTNSLSNLERWFYLNTSIGNRSNQLIRYALVLVDTGYAYDSVEENIKHFNSKLNEPLSDEEIKNTILMSAMRAIATRDSGE